MNFLYINIGKIPNYIMESFESLKKSNPDSDIFLLTDDDLFTSKGVNKLELNKVIGKEAQRILESNFYIDDSNPLWRTSMMRVFLLKDFANYLNIESFIHFDNDVLVFQDFDNFKHLFNQESGLNITRNDKDTLVFGFSYSSNLSKYEYICNHLEKILTDEILDNSNRKHTYIDNEMYLLNQISVNTDLISILPSSPEHLEENKEINYLFDPSSYGQFLDGWDEDKGISTIKKEHTISNLFLDEKIEIIFNNQKPYFDLGGKKYNLINLHIHSKNLKKYL